MNKKTLATFSLIFILALSAGLFFYLKNNEAKAFISNGANAINGLGQTSAGSINYTKSGANNGLKPNGLNYPTSTVIDTVNHRLFVSDTGYLFSSTIGNNRILVFNLDSSDNLIDYNADYVLGAPDMYTNSSGAAINQFYSPQGLALDSANNRLFVVDTWNHRVMVFDVGTITNGEDAINVLGQTNFTDKSSGSGQNKFSQPIDVAYDSTNSTLFVSDYDNNRIMVFDVSSITNGENAINVLGQSNFSGTSANTTQNGLSHAYSIALDLGSPKRLFVAEYANNRVTVFDITTITDGENAINVLGQSDYTSSSTPYPATQNSLKEPRGVVFDPASKRLFVSTGDCRIMVFDATTIDNNENAINILGQSSFNGVLNGNVSQYQFSAPPALSFGSNKLYVSDQQRNRIMIFDVTSITNGENAVNLLGQTNMEVTAPVYTKDAQNNGPSNDGFEDNAGMAIDATNHRLFVADKTNNRVLVFNLNTSNQIVDYTADYVIGQADFSSKSSTAAQNRLKQPMDVFFDETQNKLFVADAGNNRVLIFDVTSITNGANAANVLGQPNFTTITLGSTVAKMYDPEGLAYDSTRKLLYVSDCGNKRVLVFDLNVVSDGENAINWLGGGSSGQNKFTSGGQKGISLDLAGNRLFVADYWGDRVMVFDVATITNGEDAINVLGHANFTDTYPPPANASGLRYPYDTSYDPVSKRLFVTDSNNCRIMVFDVTSITNGENAVNVIGQSTFATCTSQPTVSQSELKSPRYAEYNSASGQLFVADTGRHRILVFDASANAAPTVTINSIVPKTDASGAIDISVEADDANTTDTISIKALYKEGIDCSAATTPLTINSAQGTILADSGTPMLNNSNTYQLSGLSVVDAGSNTLEFDWTSATNLPTGNGTYCVKFIPYDGTIEGTPATATVVIDNVAPTSAGNLTVSSRTQNSITYAFGAAGADANFSSYKIFYKQGASGVTTSNTELPDANLQYANYNGVTTTILSGLSANTQYVANIWTYDAYGHSAAATEIAATTLSASAPTPETPAPPSGGGGGGGGGGSSGGSGVISGTPAPSQQTNSQQPNSQIQQAQRTSAWKVNFKDLTTGAKKLSKKNIEDINIIAQIMADNATFQSTEKFSPFTVTKRQFAIQMALAIAGKNCGTNQITFSACSAAAIKAGFLDEKKIPKLQITRAQYYQMLLKAAKIPLIKKSAIDESDLCKDVKLTHEYAQVIATAKAYGIASIYTGQKCMPDQPFPRYTAATFAQRALKAAQKVKK